MAHMTEMQHSLPQQIPRTLRIRSTIEEHVILTSPFSLSRKKLNTTLLPGCQQNEQDVDIRNIQLFNLQPTSTQTYWTKEVMA